MDINGKVLVCVLLFCGIVLIVMGWVRWSPDLILFGMMFAILGVMLGAYAESLEDEDDDFWAPAKYKEPYKIEFIGEGKVRLKKLPRRKVR